MDAIAAVFLVAVVTATAMVVRSERGRVPHYVTVGRLLFVGLGVALFATDPGVAVLVLAAALLCRVRDRSYADRFRSQAESLARNDCQLYDELEIK
jgi:hypothetical protein